MKYKILDTTINYWDITLHQIMATKSFSNVNEGDLGGWVKSEMNLSQEGDCWLYDNSKAYGKSRVYENAKLYDNSEVFDNAKVYGNTTLHGHTLVRDFADIYGMTKITESRIMDNAIISDSRILSKTTICDTAIIQNAVISEHCLIGGNALVQCTVDSNSEIGGKAKIIKPNDYYTFRNFWSSNRYFTWTKSNDMWKVGCFYGTGEELIEKAYKDSTISGDNYKAFVQFIETIKKMKVLYNTKKI